MDDDICTCQWFPAVDSQPVITAAMTVLGGSTGPLITRTLRRRGLWLSRVAIPWFVPQFTEGNEDDDGRPTSPLFALAAGDRGRRGPSSIDDILWKALALNAVKSFWWEKRCAPRGCSGRVGPLNEPRSSINNQLSNYCQPSRWLDSPTGIDGWPPCATRAASIASDIPEPEGMFHDSRARLRELCARRATADGVDRCWSEIVRR